ncbi:MAG: alpha/beta hydrolase [Bacteroidota bacterium]
MSIISTTRGDFFVRTYGDPSHPPLMLVHGWPQSSYSWHHVAPFLKGLYLIAPDLRGMGDSNREMDLKAYEKDQMAADMFAVADALGMEGFYLGGHDWGGAIVQEMAFMHPERIRKLIIMNMVIINNPVGQNKAGEVLVKYLFRSSWYQFFLSIKDLPEALIAGKEDVWVRFFSRGISAPVPEDAIAEYTRCYKIPGTLTTAANVYRTVPDDRKRWAATYLGKVSPVPTKIIHGILDPVIIKEYIHGVEDFFEQVEVVEVKAGHFVVDEQPEIVGKEIKAFLAG